MTLNFDPEKNDATDFVGQSLLENYYFKNKMKNGIFTLDGANVKSGLIYGLLWGLLSMLLQIKDAGSIFAIDWKSVGNAGIIAFIAVMITLLKNLLTTNSGKFVGIVKVIPSTDESKS